MSSDNPGSNHERSWLERIGHALLGEPKDHNELLEILEHATERDILELESYHMIAGVFGVSKMQVRDIMIPRSQMVLIERDENLSEFLPRVIESGHSRFPVIGEDRDDIIGILLAKDLLSYTLDQDTKRFHVKDVIRPANIVPESKRLNTLLKEFRSNRNHMAIVVDEYGGVSGLITIEDVLEEIVGEIEDEHDIEADDQFIRQNSELEFAVKALTPIEDFNDFFNTSFSDEEFDTIGGFIASKFGHLPVIGETITVDGFNFTIARAGKRQIRSMIVEPVQASATADTPSG